MVVPNIKAKKKKIETLNIVVLKATIKELISFIHSQLFCYHVTLKTTLIVSSYQVFSREKGFPSSYFTKNLSNISITLYNC